MKLFQHILIDSIDSIINLCNNMTEVSGTSSDFPNVDLSKEEINSYIYHEYYNKNYPYENKEFI